MAHIEACAATFFVAVRVTFQDAAVQDEPVAGLAGCRACPRQIKDPHDGRIVQPDLAGILPHHELTDEICRVADTVERWKSLSAFGHRLPYLVPNFVSFDGDRLLRSLE